jgi:hypothetical protein
VIEYLRVKIKSLAEEARIIRHEEHRASAYHRGLLCAKLRDHRVKEVRPEARAALLAYAFLRGRPYTTVERSIVYDENGTLCYANGVKCNNSDTVRLTDVVNRAAYMVAKFGPTKYGNSTKKYLTEWLAAPSVADAGPSIPERGGSIPPARAVA